MNKYRNPNGDETLRVVTDTGHIALVKGDWKELPPIYHNAAIAAGCECDAPTVRKNDAKPLASSDAVKDKGADEKIEAALKVMLSRDVEKDFTGTGEPNLNIVAQLTGMRVTRNQVSPIMRRLEEEAAAEEAAAAAAAAGT